MTARRRRGTLAETRRPIGPRRAAGMVLAMVMLAPVLAGAGAMADPVADGIPAPLDGKVGDPVRGRRIVADRTVGLCLMCHSGPIPEVRQQGDVAPDLAGAGARWSAAQLRLRIVDSRRLTPGSIMPPFFGTEGATRVAARFAGRPILDAQQVEDVVAYLETLQ